MLPPVWAEAPYPDAMDHPEPTPDDGADLVSALEVIEAQPLPTRASAYEGLAEALSRRLDSGPATNRP